MTITKEAIAQYCSRIGEDTLLVQGAGGNVSWKDGDTLWIKASGMWLSEANKKEIFVPVDLPHLTEALDRRDFFIKPKLCGNAHLKPSIETLLHALLPHSIVVHLHPIEILARLVEQDFDEVLKTLPAHLQWVAVDYKKPGGALASAVHMALEMRPDANIIFLKNHGIVIGGQNLAAINVTLDTLSTLMKLHPRKEMITQRVEPISLSPGYTPISDIDLHRLATDPLLFAALRDHWTLYPDHIVFLGANAFQYTSWAAFHEEIRENGAPPELIFIKDAGTFVRETFGITKITQLRCYFDVMIRHEKMTSLQNLSTQEVFDLLSFDAEQYRINLSK